MASVAPASAPGRVPKRTRVVMTATLFTLDGAQKVRVRDISQAGAQILAEAPLLHDWDAIFKRGAIFVAARVAWSNEREVGLRFYRHLSLADVQSAFNVSAFEVAG